MHRAEQQHFAPFTRLTTPFNLFLFLLHFHFASFAIPSCPSTGPFSCRYSSSKTVATRAPERDCQRTEKQLQLQYWLTYGQAFWAAAKANGSTNRFRFVASAVSRKEPSGSQCWSSSAAAAAVAAATKNSSVRIDDNRQNDRSTVRWRALASGA